MSSLVVAVLGSVWYRGSTLCTSGMMGRGAVQDRNFSDMLSETLTSDGRTSLVKLLNGK